MALPPLAPPDHVCVDCGMDYASTTPEAAAAVIRSLPARYRAAVGGLADDRLRRRPDAQTWSIVEYVCHVRDVLVVSASRIDLALTLDRPTFEPLGNDERAVRLRYREADLAATLDELEAGAVHLDAVIAAVGADQWERTASRRPGEERDVRWMVRQAAHEGVHHLADIERMS